MRFEGPPRSRLPWVVLLAVVIVAAVVIYFLFLAPK